MAKSKRHEADVALDQLTAALARYKADHSRAQTKVYRYGPGSVRVRIIDPDFRRIEKLERHDLVWKYLDQISEETANEVNVLLLLSPEETKRSLANMDFDDPLPSLLS